jgi:hypothetical protein
MSDNQGVFFFFFPNFMILKKNNIISQIYTRKTKKNTCQNQQKWHMN